MLPESSIKKTVSKSAKNANGESGEIDMVPGTTVFIAGGE
jgi:hypothetical protein